MLSTESIIIIVVVLIAIGSIGYYCYYNLSSHENYIGSLHKRCQNLEILISQQPPPPSEIENVFEKKSRCKDGMCYLKPIDEVDDEIEEEVEEEVDEEKEKEDEKVVQKEVDRILFKETTGRRKSPLLPTPPTSTVEE
jgi:hypothetical protein